MSKKIWQDGRFITVDDTEGETVAKLKTEIKNNECQVCGDYQDRPWIQEIKYACPFCETKIGFNEKSLSKGKGGNVSCPSCKRLLIIPPQVWCPVCGKGLLENDKVLVYIAQENNVDIEKLKAEGKEHVFSIDELDELSKRLSNSSIFNTPETTSKKKDEKQERVTKEPNEEAFKMPVGCFVMFGLLVLFFIVMPFISPPMDAENKRAYIIEIICCPLPLLIILLIPSFTKLFIKKLEQITKRNLSSQNNRKSAESTTPNMSTSGGKASIKELQKEITKEPYVNKQIKSQENLAPAQVVLEGISAENQMGNSEKKIFRQPKPLKINLGDTQEFTLQSIVQSGSPMTIMTEDGRSDVVTSDLALQALEAKQHEQQGDNLAQIGRLQEASQEYKRAIELAPYEDEILNKSLGCVFLDLGAELEAVQYLETALEINPNNPDVAKYREFVKEWKRMH